jgi:hypothetical protein
MIQEISRTGDREGRKEAVVEGKKRGEIMDPKGEYQFSWKQFPIKDNKGHYIVISIHHV